MCHSWADDSPSMRRFSRALHARYVRGTTRILAPEARSSAAPSHGLILKVSPALTSLWEVGGHSDAPPAPALVRALWHRHEPQEPLRSTRNRSLPGAHLAEDVALQGHCLGLALAGHHRGASVDALRELGVNRLARRTKVSLARFAHLIDLVRDGRDGCASGVSSVTVMLAFLWATATSKECFLRFFEAAQVHLPPGSLLAHEHYERGGEWRRRWTRRVFTQHDAADGSPIAITTAARIAGVDTYAGTRAAQPAAAQSPPAHGEGPESFVGEEELRSGRGPPAHGEGLDEPLELLAYALAARGGSRPDVEQARHSYGGLKAVAG